MIQGTPLRLQDKVRVPVGKELNQKDLQDIFHKINNSLKDLEVKIQRTKEDASS